MPCASAGTPEAVLKGTPCAAYPFCLQKTCLAGKTCAASENGIDGCKKEVRFTRVADYITLILASTPYPAKQEISFCTNQQHLRRCWQRGGRN